MSQKNSKDHETFSTFLKNTGSFNAPPYTASLPSNGIHPDNLPLQHISDIRRHNVLKDYLKSRLEIAKSLKELGIYDVGTLESLTAEVERRLREQPLPNTIKRMFKDRHKYSDLKDLDIIQFLQLEWGKELKQERLSLPILSKADSAAYQAIRRRMAVDPLPKNIVIPSKSELVEARTLDPEAVRAAARLLRAVERAKRRQVVLPQ